MPSESIAYTPKKRQYPVAVPPNVTLNEGKVNPDSPLQMPVRISKEQA